MRNFCKPIFLTLALALAVEAEGLRKMTDGLNLNSSQRQQVSQILGSGDRHDPATRQRMQQQIMTVLDPQQRNQLAYQIQQQSVYNGYNNNGNYSNYNNGTYNNGNYNNGYNNNYNNANYNNGNYNYRNGYNNGNNTMQNLINSGILNGVLQNLINR